MGVVVFQLPARHPPDYRRSDRQMSRRRAAWTTVCVLAAVAALVPVPPRWIESWYSRGLYPSIQRVFTTVSNVSPIALFDLVLLAAVAATAVAVYRAVRRRGWKHGLAHVLAVLLCAAAVVYLLFLATWGLNYRRVPLTSKLAFESARVTRPAAGELAARTIRSLNRLYAAAHSGDTDLARLATAFHSAEHALSGSARASGDQGRPGSVLGRPKSTLLGGYFHYTSVSGMTDPFFLETLIASDLLDVERPFVIAHEWGHLAGYADESEANYIAWLTCMRGDERAQYSAWLALLGTVQPFLSREQGPVLDIGPRIDVYAIRYRYTRTSPVLRAAARETYDRYLKANRVERGIESYAAVLQLILGIELDGSGNPRVR
jgi:hypothetical protein